MNSFTTLQMDMMLNSLKKHLDRQDIIGYAAARNVRILSNELQEYFQFRNQLIEKYGKRDTDDEGNSLETMSITPDSENFSQFMDELEKYASIEHEPNLFKIKFEEAIGLLSGSELLEIDWMFEE